MVLRFARNILPGSKRHESKHLKKTNSNSAPLLKLLRLKHELFLFVLQSTRKMIGFKQTSNNSRNTVDMIRTIVEILVRLLFQSPCEVFLFNTYPYCSRNDTVYSSRCDKQVSKIRKSKRTLKVTDRPARAFPRLGCVNTVTQLVYELYARKVWFIPLYNLLKHFQMIIKKNNCWNFHTPVERWRGYYRVTQLSLS